MRLLYPSIKSSLQDNILSIEGIFKTISQLKLNYYIIKDMPIILGTTYSFGSDIINASNAPAGTRAKFSFYNSKGDPKDVVIYLSGLI